MARALALGLMLATFLATTSAQLPTFAGCFSSSQPLISQGYYTYQSSGHCNDVCQSENKTVLGLSAGNVCWCGNELPAANTKVLKSQCNIACQGYDLEDCGGSNRTNTFWTVWLTGLSANVPSFQGGQTTSRTSSRTTSRATSRTKTSSPTSKTSGTSVTSTTSSNSGQAISGTQSGSKHSKNQHGDRIIAIVLGVVLGFIAVALAAFLMLWAYRRRKRREQADRPSSAVLFKPESPQPDRHDEDRVQTNGNRDDVVTEKGLDSPTLPEVNILGPTPRMSTITNNSMRDSSPRAMPNSLPLAATGGTAAVAAGTAGAAAFPARKPVPSPSTQDATTTTTTTGPTITTRTVNGGPPVTTIMDHRPSTERNASNSLALPTPGNGGLRAAESFHSQASSANDPFYTPLEYPSGANVDRLDLDQLNNRESMRASTDGSHYSREEDLTALPSATSGNPSVQRHQERPESFELPIQGAHNLQGRNPPARNGPGGSYLLPSSTEIRDFDFNDRNSNRY